MAAREDQAQAVVADRHLVGLVTHRRVDGGELCLDDRVASQLIGLVPEPTSSAQSIDGAIAGGGRDPRARIGRDAPIRPDLERGDERVLDGLLGQIEIAEDADERRDRPSLLFAEEAIDDLVGRGRVSQVADAAPIRADGSAEAKSTIGRTSIDPKRMPGHCAASASAASRSAASMR